MGGLKGQLRTPQAPVRERRNTTSLAEFARFTDPGEPVVLNSAGVFTLKLADPFGIQSNGELILNLGDGLGLSSGNLVAVVQDVVFLDASGIGLNYTDPLTNSGGDLALNLGSGLQVLSAALALSIDTLSTLTDVHPVNDRVAVYDNSADTHEQAAPEDLPRRLRGIRSITADDTLTVEDETVLVDASSGPVTVTMPPPGDATRYQYAIKKIDSSANVVTVVGNGGENIDGDTSAELPSQYETIVLHGDGSQWWWIV